MWHTVLPSASMRLHLYWVQADTSTPRRDYPLVPTTKCIETSAHRFGRTAFYRQHGYATEDAGIEIECFSAKASRHEHSKVLQSPNNLVLPVALPR